MSFESDLYAELAGDAPLAALVGERIYPSGASEGVGDRAFVIYTPVFNDTRYDLDGAGDLARVRTQFDCYATTPDDAAAIARAVIAAVPESGWPVHRAAHSNQDLGLEPGTRLYRRLVEMSIVHRIS